MTYQDELKSKEWQQKRTEILKRDGYKCQICQNKNDLQNMEAGFFESYCFPNSYNALNILGLANRNWIKVGISEHITTFVKNDVILYYKELPKKRMAVTAIRKLSEKENTVFHEFEKEISTLRLQLNPFNPIEFSETQQKIVQTIYNRCSVLNENQKENITEEYNWLIFQGLHVHHKYYVQGLLAWNYPNDALVTLCSNCHETLHKFQKIQVYDTHMNPIGQYNYCLRCHGYGVFPEYNHVQGGICFRCSGARYEELIPN